MKLNATPRHYMPLPQNQSDDEESCPCKEEKLPKLAFKKPDISESISKVIRQSVIEETDPKKMPMSPLRIFMFILSLFMCVFVVIFVFFLPCKIPENLNATCNFHYKWTHNLQNMSFITPLDIIKSSKPENRLILFGYSSNEYGLIAMHESSGEKCWNLHLHSAPSSSLCNILDVNSDGNPECFITGNNGLLTAVDVKKGINLWYLHNHSDLNDADSITQPVILTDCDNDGISDLVISYNFINKENNFFLALISGANGQVIGSLLELSQCNGPILNIFSWSWNNDSGLVFYCAGKREGNLWLLPSTLICEVTLNETHQWQPYNLYKLYDSFNSIQFYKPSVSENYLVLILDQTKIIFLTRSNLHFEKLWEKKLEFHNIRIVADGYFLGQNAQLILLGSTLLHSKVIGLNIANGKKIWSFIQDTGLITSALKLSNFFESSDGLLLKTLTPISASKQTNITKRLKESNYKYKDDWDTWQNYDLIQVEENYLLVKCGKNSFVKTLDKEIIWSCCKEGESISNLFANNQTALVNEDESSINIVVIKPTVVTSFDGTSSPLQEIIIKLLTLQSKISLPQCYQ